MRRGLASQLAVVLGYVLVASAFTWPLPLQLGTHLTGDPGGDTSVYVWNQWVFQSEAFQGRNPFGTEQILALTDRIDLSQHNYTVFLNLLALPLIPMFGLVASFNLVYLAMCVLTALMTYGLARSAIGASRVNAFLAGAAFAWSPVLIARSTGHFSLAAAAPLPAFLWALVNAERNRSAKNAALVGLCMAWAALCDAYYGVYCLMIAGLYVATTIVRVTRTAAPPLRRPWVWLLDVLIVCLGGLVIGLAAGRGGDFTVLGIPVHARSLYTPVLILTVLVLARIAAWWRPRLVRMPDFGPLPLKAVLVGVLACVGPLAPVLYGTVERIVDGRFVSPKIFWRSSPRGVDLLSFVTPNPNQPVMRALAGDAQAAAPTVFVEYTASLSLIALAIVAGAIVFARYRPQAGWGWITVGFALLALGPFVYVAGVNTYVPGPWALLRYVTPIGLARMPSRFAIVSALGLSMLMAGALSAIGSRWPERRRALTALAAVLLLIELWPAPRTLYSAEISSVYDTIAGDPAPVRVLTLPFGVRDGVSSIGNFRPRSQFNQTRHQKALIGGYLSRISPRRVDRMRRDYPTLALLMKMSEAMPLTDADVATLKQRGDRFVTGTRLGYVVIDERFVSMAARQTVIDAWRLVEVERDRHLSLYKPAAP
ncbi:MAG: hypothetical protein A3J29_03450 [Acidobacteria bacterium RIFCSPLOWO2_12_FULL_67_14b]|nr:MAG: hypothetical protein A3J29_03450 [Acidobacteria bacterium RIFCSPLOWO2_12_FULL_67_14b]